MKKNINPLIRNVKRVVGRHKLAPGAYARYTMDNGTGRKMGVNEYGCADAANLLYTIGAFPRDFDERKAWIETLQGMQDAETGLYMEGSHAHLHCTAHCLAALELFDAGNVHPLRALDEYRTKEGLYKFLEEIPWKKNPWIGAHKGAGLYAAMNLAGEATAEWNNWYFDWLWEEADPDTGLWRKGCTDRLYSSMGSSFHYLFNVEYARMPIRYPDKMIDTCLKLYKEDMMYSQYTGFFGRRLGFTEADWVYCISRSLRQCGHRFEECVETVCEFADGYLDYLLSLDMDTDIRVDDLHDLFGSMCCVAELQSFLPGHVITDKPLKLVLDRRPFI